MPKDDILTEFHKCLYVATVARPYLARLTFCRFCKRFEPDSYRYKDNLVTAAELGHEPARILLGDTAPPINIPINKHQWPLFLLSQERVILLAICAASYVLPYFESFVPYPKSKPIRDAISISTECLIDPSVENSTAVAYCASVALTISDSTLIYSAHKAAEAAYYCALTASSGKYVDYERYAARCVESASQSCDRSTEIANILAKIILDYPTTDLLPDVDKL